MAFACVYFKSHITTDYIMNYATDSIFYSFSLSARTVTWLPPFFSMRWESCTTNMKKIYHEMHKIFFADHWWGINCASFVHWPTFAFLIAHAHSCTGRQVPDEGRRRDVRRAEGGGGEGGRLGAEAVHSRVRWHVVLFSHRKKDFLPIPCFWNNV